MLTKIDVHHNCLVAEEVKKLYFSAFPKYERIPWLVLWWNTKRKNLRFMAFLDGREFCGFAIYTVVDRLCYVFFFAVAENLRGKGYGSKILADLQKSYGAVGLNIEPLDPSADNYTQRESRFAFYKKNGFFDTGYDVWEVGGKFRILSTDQNLPMSQVKKAFRKLTAGFLNVKIKASSVPQFPKSNGTGSGYI